jgi:hypothetical protein
MVSRIWIEIGKQSKKRCRSDDNFKTQGNPTGNSGRAPNPPNLRDAGFKWHRPIWRSRVRCVSLPSMFARGPKRTCSSVSDVRYGGSGRVDRRADYASETTHRRSSPLNRTEDMSHSPHLVGASRSQFDNALRLVFTVEVSLNSHRVGGKRNVFPTTGDVFGRHDFARRL